MGLQDRDYYRKRDKESSGKRSRNPTKLSIYENPRFNETSGRKSRKSGGIHNFIYPALLIALLWYGVNVYSKYQAAGKTKTSPAPTMPVSTVKPHGIEPIYGGIVLRIDRQGHFRGTALVNNVPMPFLIDTGATKIAIPEKMAVAAGLPFGRSVQINTAGGKVYDRETRISSLKIGNAVIRDLDAYINGNLNEVLIGMNTLKYFRMTQIGNTLKLVANNQAGSGLSIAVPAVSIDSTPTEQHVRKPTIIKKKITCDENKNCKTSYSDR